MSWSDNRISVSQDIPARHHCVLSHHTNQLQQRLSKAWEMMLAVLVELAASKQRSDASRVHMIAERRISAAPSRGLT